MSSNKREGYLEINHSMSPGFYGHPLLGEGKIFETATQTCAHCNDIVVMNPLRRRARGYCPKCDSFICDACQAKECLPFDKVLDDQLLETYRKGQRKLTNG